MPELPEVEVIARGLAPHVIGRRITAISHSGKSLRHPVPLTALRRLLIGQRIVSITRRAKYLLLTMENRSVVLVHLGMTGRLGIFPADSAAAPHDHLRLRLDNGTELRLHDTRRFGSVRIFDAAEADDIDRTVFDAVGPEPFSASCSPKYLLNAARRRAQPVKTFLMDMAVIAGIGNIYANEALFAAGIHPRHPASELNLKDWQLLLAELRSILEHAIDCGGSTISDYLNAGGKPGYFQFHFKIYGREGSPCVRCRTPIEKLRISGRASYFCPECQKRTSD